MLCRELVVQRCNDVLQWWRDHRLEFPDPSDNARNTFCVVATIVASERVYNMAGHAVKSRRAILKSSSMNDIYSFSTLLLKLRKKRSRLTKTFHILYKQLGFLKIKDIYQLDLSKIMHKFHNNTLSQSYNSFFQRIIETYTRFTRSAVSQNYFIPRVGSSIGKRNLAYQRAVAWSSILQRFKSFSFGSFSESDKTFIIAFNST